MSKIFKNWKTVAVLALVGLASVASAQTTAAGFTATNITTSYGEALVSATPMIAAAGIGALALWAAKTPIRVGLGFLRTLFK